MDLSLFEKIMYSTLQIEMLNENSKTVGWATGFIVGFFRDKENKTSLPFLVTNRHVLETCRKIRLSFTRISKKRTPMTGVVSVAEADTSPSIFHPNDQIDLAILPLGPLLNALRGCGQEAFISMLDLKLVPQKTDWEKFDAVENVFMVGYPRGLRDTVNNLPIFRRGTTATHPSFDYCGEPKFLVDMACFRGSSGSPVYLIDTGAYVDKTNNTINLGSRVYFLGVQHAVPNLRDVGTVVDKNGHETGDIPVMQSFVNLGVIIKSTELLAFEPLIQAAVKESAGR